MTNRKWINREEIAQIFDALAQKASTEANYFEIEDLDKIDLRKQQAADMRANDERPFLKAL